MAFSCSYIADSEQVADISFVFCRLEMVLHNKRLAVASLIAKGLGSLDMLASNSKGIAFRRSLFYLYFHFSKLNEKVRQVQGH